MHVDLLKPYITKATVLAACRPDEGATQFLRPDEGSTQFLRPATDAPPDVKPPSERNAPRTSPVTVAGGPRKEGNNKASSYQMPEPKYRLGLEGPTVRPDRDTSPVRQDEGSPRFLRPALGAPPGVKHCQMHSAASANQRREKAYLRPVDLENDLSSATTCFGANIKPETPGRPPDTRKITDIQKHRRQPRYVDCAGTDRKSAV